MNSTDAVVEALRKAAAQFAYYADLHADKCTEAGDLKAKTNAEFAQMCDAALAAYQQATPTPAEDVAMSAILDAQAADPSRRLGRSRAASTPAEPTDGALIVVRNAFDDRSVARKNIALRRAHDAITAALAERDAYHEKLGDACANIIRERLRATAAEAKIAAMTEALTPFAVAAGDIDDDIPDRAEMWEHPASMGVTAGDFRSARAALASNEGGVR